MTVPVLASDPLVALGQRPLHLPTYAPGQVCPVTLGKQVAPGVGSAHGDGPVYTIYDGSPRGPAGTLSYAAPSFYTRDTIGEATPWGGQKVLIVVSPDCEGSALVRGQQLDGPTKVRFTTDSSPHPDPDPAAELRLPSGGGGASRDAPGWRLFGTTVRLRAPGCYGIQIDGISSSEVIVFQAERLPPLPPPTARPQG